MNGALRCLVLGGRGFIGSHLVNALLEAGHQVTCFDRPHLVPLGATHASDERFRFVEGDFVSEADIAEALPGCDVCFHLVSTTLPHSSNADPVFDVETNLLGTVRLLNHARSAGLRKLVFVSSGGTVYGTPTSVPIDESHPTHPLCSYGITKLAIEKYLELFHHLHGLDYCVLRIANPYGEMQRTQASQGAVAVFLGKAVRGEAVEIWGDGSVVRDFVYIGDVADALVKAMHHEGPQRLFNIGAGRGHSLNEVLDTIDEVVGRKTRRVYRPGRAFDVPANVLSIERASTHLGWRPRVAFRDGVARLASWLASNPEPNR
jgi:UDP-glucose 4-epimerase